MLKPPHPGQLTDPPTDAVHLLYHKLSLEPASYTYSLEGKVFARHLELCRRLRDASWPVMPVLTFDDGHVSNFEFALPLLAQYGLTAQFFITAGWTGKRAGYMDWSQLRALLAAGHTIGAHSWSHSLLTHCTPLQLLQELDQTRRVLEDGLGIGITTMSLPGGRFNRRILAACRNAGYTRVYTSIPRKQPLPLSGVVGRVNVRCDLGEAELAALLDPSSPALTKLERMERIKHTLRSVVGDRSYAAVWRLVNRQDKAAADAELTPP